jgi:CubicO group peptidase (beta-lactamase class C family)
MHQLTMTTGLDDGVPDGHGFLPQDLIYKADPGTRWAYHNGPYTLLERVVANATAEAFDAYFNRVLRDRIGLDGMWIWSGNDHVYYSTARGMARFGLSLCSRRAPGPGLEHGPGLPEVGTRRVIRTGANDRTRPSEA